LLLQQAFNAGYTEHGQSLISEASLLFRQHGLLLTDPFETIDEEGVGELVRAQYI
jgi:hypothetical protein